MKPCPPAPGYPHNRHPRRNLASSHCTTANWTILYSTGFPIGWASQLSWEANHWPTTGDLPSAAPEPFRGNLLMDTQEPLTTYKSEEAHLLCPTYEVPKLHHRQHQNGTSPPLQITASQACRPPRTQVP
ncbi:hypothetical protein HPB50_027711 [Hyalomma asiaticum]|nr:hypothetical protein HPB50_027711 [Hyalomma asiaticum]